MTVVLIIASIVIVLCVINLLLTIRSNKHSNKFVHNTLLKLRIPFIKTKHQGWAIGSYMSNKSLVDFSNDDIPSKNWFKINNKECSGIADPFLFKHENKFYLFFEYEYHKGLHKGADIAFAESKDGLNWEYKSKVLEEEFHQSFPLVFEQNGDIYMLPESYQSKQVRLYKAKVFPNTWELDHTLFEGKKLVDTIFLEKEGVYYWISTNLEEDCLELYYSPEFRGKWIEHPMSPITKDLKKNRNAGSIIYENDKIFRLAQDGRAGYGSGINLYEIIELSQISYKEKAVKEPMFYKNQGKIKDAIHHVSYINLDIDKKLVAVDGANFAVQSIGV